MDGAERILRGLGFSSYEARVLVALERKHPANGYEVSKLSGVPTSKIYAVLEGLRNGGFIAADESARPLRYDPLPASEIAASLRSSHDGALESLEASLRRIAPLPEPELSWNVPDYASVIARMCSMIAEARASIMLSIWPPELKALRPDIEAAIGRGLRAVIASFGPLEGLGPYAMDISGCGESSERRIGARLTVAVSDDAGVLISEIGSETDTLGLWTRSREVILVAKEYIRHDLWGRALLDELGEGALERLRGRSPLMRLLLDGK